MTDQQRLAETLRTHAQRVGSTAPLTLDDVRGRARSIRRRRAALASLAAAAVVGAVVPVGLALDGGSPVTPDRPPIATTTPSPEQDREVDLSGGVPEGEAPALPYVAGRTLVLPDGGSLDLAADYDSVVDTSFGYVVTGDAGDGERFTALLDDTGAETDRIEGTGEAAVSLDGTVVAVGATDGVELRWRGGSLPLDVGGGGTVRPVAVRGSGACDGADEIGSCSVYYRVDDASGASAWLISTWEGGETRLEGFSDLADVTADDVRVGTVSASPTGSCSAVRTAEGGQRFRTCEHSLGRLSPDGTRVLGYPAEGDGRGPLAVSVLDAQTGDSLVEFTADAEAGAFLHEAVWETESTLLASLYDGDRWVLLRLGTDGSVERAAVTGLDGATDPDFPPVHLGD